MSAEQTALHDEHTTIANAFVGARARARPHLLTPTTPACTALRYAICTYEHSNRKKASSPQKQTAPNARAIHYATNRVDIWLQCAATPTRPEPVRTAISAAGLMNAIPFANFSAEQCTPLVFNSFVDW